MRSVSVLSIAMMTCCFVARGQTVDFPGSDFNKADSIAERYAAHSLYDMRDLANKLTAPLLTEPEKFRAIFKWVCSNIEVDYALVEINKQKRAKLKNEKLVAWNKKFNALVFDKLLHERRTLCTGYAYLIRVLAFHAGFQCKIVNGYARPGGVHATGSQSINHSWNLVQLNHKWYACDATWASGLFNRATGQFVKRYNDHYFLTDPAIFARDHLAMQ